MFFALLEARAKKAVLTSLKLKLEKISRKIGAPQMMVLVTSRMTGRLARTAKRRDQEISNTREVIMKCGPRLMERPLFL